MRANIGSGEAVVVDARGAGRFAGAEAEPRPGVRAGHIPGSRNVPFTQVPGFSRQNLRVSGLPVQLVLTTGLGALQAACGDLSTVAVADADWVGLPVLSRCFSGLAAQCLQGHPACIEEHEQASHRTLAGASRCSGRGASKAHRTWRRCSRRQAWTGSGPSLPPAAPASQPACSRWCCISCRPAHRCAQGLL